MRAVFALVLLAGMALAGFAVFMAQNYVGQSEARVARAMEMQNKTGKLVEVYAAKTALKYGDPLTAEAVHKVWAQEKLLPTGTFGDAAVLFPENNDKPRFAMRSIEANEILLASRLTAPGEVAGLTGKLDKGMRAFQIRVSSASGVAGFVMPDDYIDIYWTGSGSGESTGEVTRMIESAIRIIAVDQSSEQSQRSEAEARTVTVAATPEQVARLAQAQATGRLSMALVSANDGAIEGLVEVDHNKLLGVTKQEVVKIDAPEVCTIKTRKGADVVEIPIPCPS